MKQARNKKKVLKRPKTAQIPSTIEEVKSLLQPVDEMSEKSQQKYPLNAGKLTLFFNEIKNGKSVIGTAKNTLIIFQRSAKCYADSMKTYLEDTGANVVVGVSEKPVSIGHFSPGYEVKNEHSTVSKSHNTHKQQSHNTSGYGNKNNQGESGATTPSPKNSKSSERSKAVEYYHYVSTEGRCQWPKPKVIRVRDMHTNLAATYMPHCAILHRCSDDTGCCKTETETCEAKTTETVELYFMSQGNLFMASSVD
ncbi:hypothetical protein QAD02_000910 [Eretmocerus hayati]|uniref:Uncharacterized protein n=1 Tax=Eretmocerus hayati TaxID=131215 RepID=A0ACC2NEX9_9HYME|nr:hypothetical protein QAD02_000910 [Eretmocerus hayati]